MSEIPTSANRERRAKQYHRIRRRLSVVAFALSLAVLIVLLLTGWSIRLRDTALAITPRQSLALLFYLLLLGAITKLVSLPLSVYSGYVLEHRFELSNQSLKSWIRDYAKGLALSFVLGAAGAEWVYFTLHHYPAHWWVLSAGVFVLFFILLAHLAPVLIFPLFFKFKPLENEELLKRLLRLSEQARTRVGGVWEWKLSEKSRKSNAALVGMGATRRIILADTLLENYTEDEIEAILAHELGHHVHNHIWKGIALETVLVFLSFFCLHQSLLWGTARFGFRGSADFANLPLLLIVGSVISFLAMPAANAFSRHMEREADDYALRSTGARDAFISGMEKLAAQNLAERSPHPVIEFLFSSHPSVEKRIARARRGA